MRRGVEPLRNLADVVPADHGCILTFLPGRGHHTAPRPSSRCARTGPREAGRDGARKSNVRATTEQRQAFGGTSSAEDIGTRSETP